MASCKSCGTEVDVVRQNRIHRVDSLLLLTCGKTAAPGEAEEPDRGVLPDFLGQQPPCARHILQHHGIRSVNYFTRLRERVHRSPKPSGWLRITQFAD